MFCDIYPVVGKKRERSVERSGFLDWRLKHKTSFLVEYKVHESCTLCVNRAKCLFPVGMACLFVFNGAPLACPHPELVFLVWADFIQAAQILECSLFPLFKIFPLKIEATSPRTNLSNPSPNRLRLLNTVGVIIKPPVDRFEYKIFSSNT